MAPKIMKQGVWAPLLYMLPALIIMSVFVVYPSINTVRLSFLDAAGVESAGTTCVEGRPCWGAFENYRYALTNPDMVTALRNNALWLLLMVPATVVMGLLIALLADRVKYEPLAKSAEAVGQTLDEWVLARLRPLARRPVLSGDARLHLNETKCDGVLLGRGALGNPFVFKQIQQLRSGKKIIPTIEGAAQRKMAVYTVPR